MPAGAAIVAAMLTALVARADQADDQFAVASGHYVAQRWQLAADEFQAFLQQYPQHEKADAGVFLRAEALLQLGRSQEAGRHFRDYLDRAPDGQYARAAMFRAGEALFLAGQRDEAKAELDRFRAKYPDDQLNAYVLPYLGEIAMAGGEAAAAERCFRDGLARFPDGRLQDDCRVGLARALEKQNQCDEAERLYLAVAGKPTSSLAGEAQFRFGALQYASGRYAQAIETFTPFDRELSASPWRASAAMGRGWALLKLDRPTEARPIFERLATDPRVGMQARYWLGLTQKTQGDWAAAAKTLLAAADSDPKHPLCAALRFQAGDALLKSGDSDGAARQFDQVLALPDEGNEWIDAALRGKTEIALQAKNHTAVEAEAAEFERRCPKSPLLADVRRMLATSLLERKSYAAAAKVLDALLAADGKDAQGLSDRYLLAVAYEGLQRYDEALAVLLPVADAATGRLTTDAQLRQGQLLIAMQKYAEAVEPLEAAMRSGLSGDQANTARGELAICYARTGQIDKAKKLCADLQADRAKLELLAPITEQLAEAAYAAGDTAWAGELFGRLGKDATAAGYELKGLAGLGWTQLKAGRLAEAAATFETLLKKRPPDALAAEAALARGQALQQLQQSDAALAMYDLVIEKYPQAKLHADALWAAARLRDRLQQPEPAAALYERLARDYPKFAKRDAVLYHWSWALYDLDKSDRSSEVLTRLRNEYPESSFAADAAYRLAQRAFQAKNYAQAKHLLHGATDAADPRTRDYARYLRGHIAAAEQDWEGVRQVYEALLKETSDAQLRLVAEFWTAESAYRRGEFDSAQRLFDELDRHATDSREPWLAMVPLRRAQIAAQQDRWDDAFALAASIEKHYPQFEQQYEADYLLGRCLHHRAELDDARAAFQKVIRSPAGAKTETAAMAQWMIGETYFHQKKYDAALREYLRLEILYAYPKWQAAALLQAGKCRDLLGQPSEAAELYSRLQKLYPDTPFAQEASQRLRASPKPEQRANR